MTNNSEPKDASHYLLVLWMGMRKIVTAVIVVLIMLYVGMGGCSDERAGSTTDHTAIQLARECMKFARDQAAAERFDGQVVQILCGIAFLAALTLPAIVLVVLLLVSRRSANEEEVIAMIEHADQLIELDQQQRLTMDDRAALPSPMKNDDDLEP